MSRQVPKSLGAFLGAVVATAVLVGLLVNRLGPPSMREVALFWVLYSLAHWPPMEIQVSGVIKSSSSSARPPSLSAGFLVLMTAAFVLSPSTAFFVGMLSPLVPGSWRGGVRTIFNSAQGAIYTSLAALAYGTLKESIQSDVGILVPAIGAALVAVAINTLAVSSAIALERGWGFTSAVRQLLWPASHSLVFALVGLLVAMMYEDPELGPLAVLFMLSPLVILRAVRRSKLELEAARNGTLEMFVRAVESKDPYTSQHSARVALVANEIYRELGVKEGALESRFLGALLHDIGKIGVPRRVLLKPDALTKEEFEWIKIHPSLGADTVAEVEYLEGLVPEIRHHHERVDGRGYPDGLGLDEIPFEARVVAVADTFEALTSDRPYRTALSPAEALREIESVAGAQLDPEVVDAFGRVVKRGFSLPLVKDQFRVDEGNLAEARKMEEVAGKHDL